MGNYKTVAYAVEIQQHKRDHSSRNPTFLKRVHKEDSGVDLSDFLAICPQTKYVSLKAILLSFSPN